MSAAGDTPPPIRVLFVDDSKIQQGLWTRLLAQSDDIVVAGSVGCAEQIMESLATVQPDVILLDINLPGISGVEFLERADSRSLPPCIILSAFVHGAANLRARALAAGAVDIIAKPREGSPAEIKEVFGKVRSTILRVYHGPNGGALPAESCAVEVPEFGATAVSPALSERLRGSEGSPSIHTAILIGSSTGGPAVLAKILVKLRRPHPPVLIAQHISSKFTRSLARSLREQTGLHVVEARSGDAIQVNTVYVAPGNRHMRARLVNDIPMLLTVAPLPGCHHCPSVDEMMSSAVTAFGRRALGVLLTGMGTDGAAGLLAMHHAGCRTIVQDEASSTVFGMPRAAIERGGVDVVGSPDVIIDEIERWIRASKAG